MMIYMGLDRIVNHDRDLLHARIFNVWIEDWESDTLRIPDQGNDQRLLQKYKNIRLLDDEDNKTYMISPESLDIKDPTRRNKKYCVVGQPLNCRDGDNMDLLISREINDYLMIISKGI